jgi:hypothetical protein
MKFLKNTYPKIMKSSVVEVCQAVIILSSNYVLKVLCQFAFLPAIPESCSCCAPLLAVDIVTILVHIDFVKCWGSL